MLFFSIIAIIIAVNMFFLGNSLKKGQSKLMTPAERKRLKDIKGYFSEMSRACMIFAVCMAVAGGIGLAVPSMQYLALGLGAGSLVWFVAYFIVTANRHKA